MQIFKNFNSCCICYRWTLCITGLSLVTALWPRQFKTCQISMLPWATSCGFCHNAPLAEISHMALVCPPLLQRERCCNCTLCLPCWSLLSEVQSNTDITTICHSDTCDIHTFYPVRNVHMLKKPTKLQCDSFWNMILIIYLGAIWHKWIIGCHNKREKRDFILHHKVSATFQTKSVIIKGLKNPH